MNNHGNDHASIGSPTIHATLDTELDTHRTTGDSDFGPVVLATMLYLAKHPEANIFDNSKQD